MTTLMSGVLSMTLLLSSIPGKTIEYVAPEPPKELSVQEKIVKYASDYGVNVEIMLDIADDESDFKGGPNYLYTGEDGRYTAYGIFQITRTTWKTYCGEDTSLEQRSNEDKNIECAMKIASKSGYHHWDESGIRRDNDV